MATVFVATTIWQVPTTDRERDEQEAERANQMLSGAKWKERPQNTVKTYDGALKLWRWFCKDQLGDTDDRALVTAGRLVRFCLYLKRDWKGKGKKNQGLSMAYDNANNHVSALR